MKSLMLTTALVVVSLMQGCATAPNPASLQSATASDSPIRMCAGPGCANSAIKGVQVAADPNAPLVDGHPMTSVVVTQCNLVVAVYMTMPDGRLLRFDKNADVPAEQLVSIAYTATRSERVEVSCEGAGAVGFEKHDSV